MARKRGRITVQSQPTKETRTMERLATIPFLIVSIFFVIIGVTAVIPMAGLFGVVWTLVAICFAVIGIVNMVRKNGMAHRVAYDVEQDPNRSRCAPKPRRLRTAAAIIVHRKSTHKQTPAETFPPP